MGGDKLFENTPNARNFICPNCLPKPKVWDFDEKKVSLGVRSLWSGVSRCQCILFSLGNVQ
jgi:hypothetical protein